MTLEERIQEMRANIENARATHELSINERSFNRDTYELNDKLRKEWIRLQMEIERHGVEMAKLWLEQQWRVRATASFASEARRLRTKEKKLELEIEQSRRHLRDAEILFQGQTMRTRDRIKCWRSFGRFALKSQTKFPGANEGEQAVFQTKRKDNWVEYGSSIEPMTMHQLSKFCRRKRLVLNPSHSCFESIRTVFAEISESQIKAFEKIDLEIAAKRERLDAINDKQWEKAGLI